MFRDDCFFLPTLFSGLVVHSLHALQSVCWDQSGRRSCSSKVSDLWPSFIFIFKSIHILGKLCDTCSKTRFLSNCIGFLLYYRSTLLNLVQHTSDGLVDAFDHFLAEHKGHSGKGNVGGAQLPLTQNRALQLTFDIKFVANMLSRKDESEVGKLHCNKYECNTLK